MDRKEAINKKNNMGGEKDRHHLLPSSELESTWQEAVSAHYQHPLLFLAEIVVVMHLPSWLYQFHRPMDCDNMKSLIEVIPQS